MSGSSFCHPRPLPSDSFSTTVVNISLQNDLDLSCSCGSDLFAHESLLSAGDRVFTRDIPRFFLKTTVECIALAPNLRSVANQQQRQNPDLQADK